MQQKKINPVGWAGLVICSIGAKKCFEQFFPHNIFRVYFGSSCWLQFLLFRDSLKEHKARRLILRIYIFYCISSEEWLR